MNNVPHDLPYDSRLARMRKRLQGLQRVAAAINDLYIYGVYPSNYPNLTTVLEQAKDHTKNIIKETKKSIKKNILLPLQDNELFGLIINSLKSPSVY